MFCRIGDFYELFYEDAIVAARELQLTLTARDREKKQPMCGVPYHAAEQYIQRLLRKGYRIALCEQMEDPKLTKKIVRREVTRVLTPGTAVDGRWARSRATGLQPGRAASGARRRGAGAAGPFYGGVPRDGVCGGAAWAQLADELGQARPAELLFAEGMGLAGRGVPRVTRIPPLATRLEGWVPDGAAHLRNAGERGGRPAACSRGCGRGRGWSTGSLRRNTRCRC